MSRPPGAPDAAAERREAESGFARDVERHLRRNYTAHLLHGLLGQTGFRLIQAPTFIPAYVYLLSGSDVGVGLARGFQSLGMFLSPLIGATLIEHRRRVLGTGLVVGALMRLQILGIVVAGFTLSQQWNLYAVWLFLGLFGFFLGMQGVIFNFMVSKLIPLRRRGVLMGLRNAIAGVVAAGVGVVGGRLVDAQAFGNGYAATFGVAFGLTSLGLLMLGFVREPASPSVRRPSGVLARLRDVPPLLRSDPGFTRYFVARACASMGRMAVPFYVLYAATHIELDGAALGWLTGAFLIAQSVTNLGWGAVADRTGFRRVFMVSVSLWIASALLLFAAGDLITLVGVFLGLGAGLGGFMMSAQNMVLEFGSRENLPVRIAVANASAELVGAVGPVAGGLLAARFAYPAVIGTAVAFQLVALALMLRVADPRWRRRL